jgi:prepilin-type N-terminal cleavage/methylation domain-containing protein
MRQARFGQAGFTMVEMAMVLAVIVFLLGSGLAVFHTQVEQQRISDTKKALEEAKQALIGRAAATTPPSFPCPDRTVGAGANDGLEDRTNATTCPFYEGNLPWVTLGIPGKDAWGNRLRYRVTPAFINQTTGIALTSVGTLTVNDENGNVLAQAAPVVLLSHGVNGFGATSGGGVVIAAPPAANINELENTNGNAIYVMGPKLDEAAAVGGVFDDIVTWMPTTLILSRLIDAGKY